MSITVREYGENDIKGMISVWNEVVRDGVAFPQTEELDFESGKKFFAEQTCCPIATDENGEVLGMYILHPNTNCEFVATDCVTGKAKYFSENKSEQRLLDSVRASCTVPILYQISEFEGGKYVDGSIADAVPFDRAFEQGCSRVLVLLTKPENEPCTDYRKFEFLINKKRTPSAVPRHRDRTPQTPPCRKRF